MEKLAEILPIFADAGSKIEIKPRLSAEEISLEKNKIWFFLNVWKY